MKNQSPITLCVEIDVFPPPFPLHYFECIEEYYISTSEQQKKLVEDQLNGHLRNSGQYESFLADFYHMSEVPVKKWGSL
ncbi:hypothetical protein ACPJHQ_19860 [Rossellomorea sp. H39__3]